MLRFAVHVHVRYAVVWFAGATRDLGSSLTRFCLRHRNLEGKMRHLCRQDYSIGSILLLLIILIILMIITIMTIIFF